MRTVHVAATDLEAARVYAALEKEARAVRSTGRMPAALARAAEASVDERAVVGTQHEVADRLARYRERLGMDLVVVRPQIGAASPAEREASLERLASEVIPTLSN
jgi:alkanesulfonate monooxygenase SsuD/methylene tetrahydromethanopterin reductase-like flavin-dependent oxidoreductase (luciferase family)